jgi:hypothetical protein
MFLCEKCHESCGCSAMSRSFGPCESCNKTAHCIDCHAPAKTSDTPKKKAKKKAPKKEPKETGNKNIVVEWRGVKLSRYSDTFAAALKIKDSEVDAFLDAHEKAGIPRGIALSNLSYFAGYYDAKTAAKFYKKFNSVHPIFGKVSITPKEAFKAGKQAGQKAVVRKTKRKAVRAKARAR